MSWVVGMTLRLATSIALKGLLVLFWDHVIWLMVVALPQSAFSTAWPLANTVTSDTSHNAQAAPLAASPSISMARPASLISLWNKFMLNPRIGGTAFRASLGSYAMNFLNSTQFFFFKQKNNGVS
jgi:hypothetical protein